jgi:hypothetical protein
MVMTTVFENRFDNPDAFLGELAKDEANDAIQDRILRLAYRSAPAKYIQLAPNHAMARTDEKLAWWFRGRFVEASFLARGQLTKLSAYCGLGFNRLAFEAVNPDKPALAARYSDLNLETEARLQDLVHRLQTAARDLDIRDGATFVEEGAWIADPQSPIEPVPAPTCATCEAPIYLANGWRHQYDRALNTGCEIQKGRAEATVKETCPMCKGDGETNMGRRTKTRCPRCLGSKTIPRLHHLADPVLAGRLV